MARQFAARRRSRRWLSLAGDSTLFTGSSTVHPAGLANFTTPETIVRCMGGGAISPTGGGTFAAGDKCQIGLGLVILSTDAFAVGAAAVPEPINEAALDWLYWRVFQISIHGAAPAGDENGSSFRFTFDVKSQRKVTPNRSFGWVLQYVDVAGAPPMTLDTDLTRVLILES